MQHEQDRILFRDLSPTSQVEAIAVLASPEVAVLVLVFLEPEEAIFVVAPSGLLSYILFERDTAIVDDV